MTQRSLTAQGGESSANMQVTANVIRKCTVTTQPLAFGNYDPVQANYTAPLDGQTTLTVACTKGTAVNIAMDAGTNAQGTVRRMAGGNAAFLGYEVYKDASRSEVWGATRQRPARRRRRAVTRPASVHRLRARGRWTGRRRRGVPGYGARHRAVLRWV